jgi:hypothetical protein
MPDNIKEDTLRLQDIIEQKEQDGIFIVEWLIQLCDEYENLWECIVPAIKGLWDRWGIDVRNADMFIVMNEYYDDVSHDADWGEAE